MIKAIVTKLYLLGSYAGLIAGYGVFFYVAEYGIRCGAWHYVRAILVITAML